MPAVPIGTVSGSKKRKRAEGVESKNQGLVDSAAAKTREVRLHLSPCLFMLID